MPQISILHEALLIFWAKKEGNLNLTFFKFWLFYTYLQRMCWHLPNLFDIMAFLYIEKCHKIKILLNKNCQNLAANMANWVLNHVIFKRDFLEIR